MFENIFGNEHLEAAFELAANWNREMNALLHTKCIGRNLLPCIMAAILLLPWVATAKIQSVIVTVADDFPGADIAPRFLGLSYETSILLQKNGCYYFDATNAALVNIFKTLGIKSLRVGANAVDDSRVPVPQEKDIDKLFGFAKAAGVKVIYSFRLKDGDAAESARLARYIMDHYADVLDCFAIGNEPDFYFPTFEAFFACWKSQYDAILRAVPEAIFDGPSVAKKSFYTVDLAGAMFASGHLAMASDHYYFLGNGRAGEKDPPATRARFLSNNLHDSYEKAYASVGAILAARGVPYRIDEMNSCARGGAKDSSDTYASTLWALDCTHWLATHHILGVNYHTGVATSYAAFVPQAEGSGFAMRPQAYAYLAFSQGTHGRPLTVKIQADTNLNFNAYAYQDHSKSFFVTLINKSYGDTAQTASACVQLPRNANSGIWQQMILEQKDKNIAAKDGVTLGGANVDFQGSWSGQWGKLESADSGRLVVQVPPASALILRFAQTSLTTKAGQ